MRLPRRSHSPAWSALEAARLLLYSKVDPETTARVIDDALAATPNAADVLRVQALILRADAANELGDDSLARSLLDEAASINLEDVDQATIADDLTRAEELRSSLA